MAKFAGTLDATVLLRLVLDDMPREHAAAAHLLESSRHSFAVADTSLIELIFVLENHYQMNRAAIQETIEALLSLPNIAADRQLFAEALPPYVAHKSLSFEECYMDAYAGVQQATPLWTFDKKLARQVAGARLATDLPE